MAWNVIGTYILDDPFGFQSANKIRDNLVALASTREGRSFGGSRRTPNFPVFDPWAQTVRSKYPGLGPHDAEDYVDVELDATLLTGLTVRARVEVRTNNPGVSITPKIRNVSGGTDAGTGSACTAGASDFTGTNQKQTITITLGVGIQKYRLMYTLGANAMLADTWCVGELEVFATA
jgi:hypothetical protein